VDIEGKICLKGLKSALRSATYKSNDSVETMKKCIDNLFAAEGLKGKQALYNYVMQLTTYSTDSDSGNAYAQAGGYFMPEDEFTDLKKYVQFKKYGPTPEVQQQPPELPEPPELAKLAELAKLVELVESQQKDYPG
jgi:hypothetical protein